MDPIDYKQMTKIKRIPMHLWGVPGFKEIGKDYLTQEETYELFDWKTTLQEKYDGKSCYEIKEDKIYFYEDLSQKHSIEYVVPEQKPRVYFDVYDMREKRFMFPDKAFYLMEKNGMNGLINSMGFVVLKSFGEGRPEIDKYLKEAIPGYLNFEGQYSKKVEGFVVKNYHKQLFGKIINPEFEQGIKENYIRNERHRQD